MTKLDDISARLASKLPSKVILEGYDEHGYATVNTKNDVFVNMENSVANWESIVHKNVRTSDNENAGNVIEVEDKSITIVHGTKVEFVVPKDHVDGFDGAEVRLDLPYSNLGQYVKKT